MKRNILIASVFIISLLNASCASTKYSVVGAFDDYDEVMIGEVNNNMFTGTATMTITGQKSGMRCAGTAATTYVPPSLFDCAGQKGGADLLCDDGRVIKATYTTLSCSKGYGTGLDQRGNKFTFTFGMPHDEAMKVLEKELEKNKNKPDLPPVYKPKEVRKEKGFATGTGFLVSKEGLILTNYHVIEGADKVFVQTSDGKKIAAAVIKTDPRHDVALIKSDIVGVPLPISDSTGLLRGQQVLTLGYPLITLQGQEQKASFGRINALTGVDDDLSYMQIDVPIQPGNSGGPLIDSRGRVVGIVTATLNQLGAMRASGAIPQNVNYAIKSDYAIPLLKSAIPTWLEDKVELVIEMPLEQVVQKSESSVFLIISE